MNDKLYICHQIVDNPDGYTHEILTLIKGNLAGHTKHKSNTEAILTCKKLEEQGYVKLNAKGAER